MIDRVRFSDGKSVVRSGDLDQSEEALQREILTPETEFKLLPRYAASSMTSPGGPSGNTDANAASYANRQGWGDPPQAISFNAPYYHEMYGRIAKWVRG